MQQIFQYPSEIHEIPNIRKDLGMLENAWRIPKSKMRQIMVIVEELFSNIVRFGFEDDLEHKIEIRMNRNENFVDIEIIDDGIAFNPLEYCEDPQRDPAQVESGGMGLILVQTFSNKMSYQRKGAKNYLRIEKKI
jgi:anti-sigma regulatory factor (Ser/Thr protein kinase)